MSGEAPKGRKGRERGSGQAVMTDVAKLARVSHQTVSRVLHDSPHVKGDTRERVLAAMRQLNYRPNPVAQALVTGRSRVLGVVTLDTVHYGPASTLLGIEEAAHNAGYAVSITSLRSRSRTSVLDAVQLLRDQAVDGVVVIAPHIAAVEALRQLPPGLPVVAVGAGSTNAVPVVAVDQVPEVGRRCIHLLLEQLEGRAKSKEHVLVPIQLILRQSTAAAAKAR